ncbi:MAG: substrate-binding domain-containing protein [Lachnospirales bacterium]
MAKITIKEVAKEAGVSVGSVHLAINNKSGISEKHKSHILDVANKLGYRPNLFASNLKRETRIIGVLLPKKNQLSAFYFDYMWKAVEDFELRAKDYNLQIEKFEYVNFAKAVSEIDLESINGLITVGYAEGDYENAIKQVTNKKIPFILLDGDYSEVDSICCIKPNTWAIGRLTAELLMHTVNRFDGKILIAGGDENFPNHYEIVNSIKEYLNYKGMKDRVVVEYVWQSEEANETKVKELEEILLNEKIIGCCSVTSKSTLLLSRALANCGLSGRIPFIGNGMFKESAERMKEDTITAIINKKPYEQCFEALDIMSDLIAKNISPTEKIVDVGVDVIFKSLLEQYEDRLLLK